MTQKQTTGIVVGLIIVLVAGAAAFASVKKTTAKKEWRPTQTSSIPSETTNPNPPATTTNPTANQPAPKPPAPTVTSFTMADVAKHNNQNDCWSAVNGSVYNLTEWIAQHPGGERAILGMCGIDASDAFNNQHGGQGRPERILASMKIGVLTQ